jgi:hypothetical protein
MNSDPTGTEDSVRCSKQLERETDHSLLRLRMFGSYITTPPYVFMVWCLVNDGDNFVPALSTTASFWPLSNTTKRNYFWTQVYCSRIRCLIKRHSWKHGKVEEQLCIFLTSALDRNEWSTSRSDSFASRENLFLLIRQEAKWFSEPV